MYLYSKICLNKLESNVENVDFTEGNMKSVCPILPIVNEGRRHIH